MRPVAGSASTNRTVAVRPACGIPVQRASTGGSARKTSPGSPPAPFPRSTTTSNSCPIRPASSAASVRSTQARPTLAASASDSAITSGRVGSAARSQSAGSSPAVSARHSSVPNRSTSRRSGAVTCA
jgi:hypothetical protein